MRGVARGARALVRAARVVARRADRGAAHARRALVDVDAHRVEAAEAWATRHTHAVGGSGEAVAVVVDAGVAHLCRGRVAGGIGIIAVVAAARRRAMSVAIVVGA